MLTMKRVLYILLIAAIFGGCQKEPALPSNALQIDSGISNNSLYIGGREGDTATFSISAEYDWRILPTKGFVCEPSSGTAGKRIKITAQATESNNSRDTVRLDKLSFKLQSTVFVGIAAYQYPQIAIKSGYETVYTDAGAGATATVELYSATPDFDIVCNGDIDCRVVQRNTQSGQYTLQVTSTKATGSDNIEQIGTVAFEIDGKRQGASVEVRKVPVRPTAEQTILFYFLGTSLKPYYNNNIANIIKAAGKNILGNARILLFTQSSSTEASLDELLYDTSARQCATVNIKSYTLTLPYTQATLSEQIADMVKYAPARNYGLVIGSHGKAWIPTATPQTAKLAQSIISAREKLWTPAQGALQTRNIGDTSATQYNTATLATAIADAGIKLQYIIFDACFMSSAEAAYDLRNSTDYIVASPCEIMSTGLPYDSVLPELLLDGGAHFDLDAVCRRFVEYYRNTPEQIPSACSAVIDCSQLEKLAQAMLRINTSGSRTITLADIQSYEGLSSHLFYDLEDYVRQSCTDEQAIADFSAQLAKTVSSRYHTDEFYSAYNKALNAINYYSGITTSAPILFDDSAQYRDEWQQTEWYMATH